MPNSSQPNFIMPTPTAGDSSNRAASTQFVATAIANAIGSAANNGNQGFTVAHTNFSTAQSGLALTCTFSTTAGSSDCFAAFSPP